jgi:hypothetical protein
MITLETPPSLITTTHRAKLAYVYVRQSSLGQVTRHGESTDLQYQLRERAVALGWPRERVLTIDEDLGKSGSSAEQRAGFQRLIAEVSLARVGLVLSLDASRLARNNRERSLWRPSWLALLWDQGRVSGLQMQRRQTRRGRTGLSGSPGAGAGC